MVSFVHEGKSCSIDYRPAKREVFLPQPQDIPLHMYQYCQILIVCTIPVSLFLCSLQVFFTPVFSAGFSLYSK